MAWRNLLKHRSSAVINIGGLALGLTTSILVVLFVAIDALFVVSIVLLNISTLSLHVLIALQTSGEISTLTCPLCFSCLLISIPIFSSISSSCSNKSINRLNSFAASEKFRRNRRISRTESTSWIARETTAMPLAAALSPSISRFPFR